MFSRNPKSQKLSDREKKFLDLLATIVSNSLIKDTKDRELKADAKKKESNINHSATDNDID